MDLIKRRFLFPYFLLFFIVGVSLWHTLIFDLWQDDNALIFKIMHPNEPAGVFGQGILGEGPYRYIATPYIYLSQIFGVNIPIFYFASIIVYFLATLALFISVKSITKNKELAILSAGIFGAGFIGSDGILRLFNTLQTSYSMGLVIIMFACLFRFSRTKKYLYYMLALLIFLITLETGYVRVQYILFPTITFFILFILNLQKIKSYFYTSVLAVPFLLSYYQIYLKIPDPRSKLLTEYINFYFQGKFDATHSFFATIGNIFIPNLIIEKLINLTSGITLNLENQIIAINFGIFVLTILLLNIILKLRSKKIKFLFFLIELIWLICQWAFFVSSDNIALQTKETFGVNLIANFIGGSVLIILITLSFAVFKINKEFSKLILFFSSILIFVVLSYAVYLPFSPYETIHRYITHSIVAYSVLIPLSLLAILNFILKIKNPKNPVRIICISLIFLNLLLANIYQNNFVNSITRPTKAFYSDLKKFVPKIEKNSAFYFDIAGDKRSKKEFHDFFSVGSMPDSTAIAWRYGLDRYDITVSDNYEDFINSISEKKTPVSNIYTFYYDYDGLKYTTKEAREVLTKNKLSEVDIKNTKFIPEYKEYSEQLTLNPLVKDSRGITYYLGRQVEIKDINLPSVTPLNMIITAKARGLIGISNSLPLKDLTPKYQGEDMEKLLNQSSEACNSKQNSDVKKLYTEFIINRFRLVKQLKSTTSPTQTGYDSGSVSDGNEETIWRGDRGTWAEKKELVVTLDLGELLEVGRFDFINSYQSSTPTTYKIETSIDQKFWKEVKLVKGAGYKKSGERVIEKFAPQEARFIRIVVLNTFDNDSPGFSEVEAFESKYVNVNLDEVLKFQSHPAECILSKEDLNSLMLLSHNVGIRFYVAWKNESDKVWHPDKVTTFLLPSDNLFHQVSVSIPEGGIKLNELKIGPANIPSELEIGSIKVLAKDGFTIKSE